MLLEVKGLTKAFAGLVAVKGVDFTVQKGEILGLIGPNGAGKTTIFHLLTGYHKPTAGTVLFNGRDMTHVTPPAACRLGLTRTFQIVKPLVQLTVLENVMVGAFAKIGNAKKAKELALRDSRIHRSACLQGYAGGESHPGNAQAFGGLPGLGDATGAAAPR